jgi:hypothetical protein
MAYASSDVYFRTSDNDDGSFWICGDTDLNFGSVRGIQIALDLDPKTSMADADALAALLRKHVKQARLWTPEPVK